MEDSNVSGRGAGGRGDADPWAGWWQASDGNWYPPAAGPWGPPDRPWGPPDRPWGPPAGPWGPPDRPWGPPDRPWGSPGGAGRRLSVTDERTWAMVAHLSHFFGGWIVQLVIMFTKGTESAFVRDQAVEALNFSITLVMALIVSAVLCLVLIGFVLLAGVLIASAVFAVMGAVRAYRGEWYRYPVCLRLVH